MNTEHKFTIENTDQLIGLLNVYLDEWNSRNESLWKQVFTYYFSILIVMILPFMSSLGIDFGNVFPKWIFPAIGLALSLVFLIVSLGYAARLRLVSEIYRKLISNLDKEYQRLTLEEVYSKCTTKILGCRMTTLICWVMFITLFLLGTILIVISL